MYLASREEEQERMGGEDTGPDPEEQARRIEALERENRELRDALVSGASHDESKGARQQPQVRGATDASPKTVRGRLLGPRNERAYSRPLAGVFPSYVVGWLLTLAVGSYGAYVAFLITVGPHSVGTIWLGLGPLAAMFFGAYGGIRDGGKFAFATFQYVGLITAIGTTVVVFLVSLGITHWYWSPEAYRDIGFAFRDLITDELNPFVLGAVFVTAWLLFVSGAMLGTALQLWANGPERVGRRDSIQYDDERGSASTPGVRAQLWLGFAGTVIAALIGLIGTLLAGR
jgi:hypothetical protein